MGKGRKATTITSRNTNRYTCPRPPRDALGSKDSQFDEPYLGVNQIVGFLSSHLLATEQSYKTGHTGCSIHSCCPTSSGSSLNSKSFLVPCHFIQTNLIFASLLSTSSFLFESILSSYLKYVDLPLPVVNPPLMSYLFLFIETANTYSVLFYQLKSKTKKPTTA